MNGVSNFQPKKGDIITLDFEPSVGREIKKRRPALVVSNSKYSKLTGLLVIVPITSKPNTKMIEYGIYQEVKHNKVRGYVNPLQFHTFDYKKRNAKYIGKTDKDTLKKVLKLINNIINAKEL